MKYVSVSAYRLLTASFPRLKDVKVITEPGWAREEGPCFQPPSSGLPQGPNPVGPCQGQDSIADSHIRISTVAVLSGICAICVFAFYALWHGKSDAAQPLPPAAPQVD